MKEHVFHLEKKSLRRVLGVWDLFAIGYGDIGSSIYYALGITALHSLGATPISLIIAGFVFICTALTYAELSSTFPEPGGSSTFTRYAFNDLISFIAGWGLLLDYIVTIAISAFAVPPYLRHVLALFNLPSEWIGNPTGHLTFTVGLIGFLLLLNILGTKHSARLSLFLAAFTIATQLFIIAVGILFVMNLPLVISHLKIGLSGVSWSPSWKEFFTGTAMAMVAYTGIESIAQLAAESKKPGIVVPRSIIRTVGILLILYLGISITGLSVVSARELGTTYLNDPIAAIVLHFPFGGKWLAPWVGFMAALLLLVAANAGLLGCSRLVFSMGEHYQVPHCFYKLHSYFRTPYLSLVVFAFLASLTVLASHGKITFLAELYNFGAMIAFFFAHLSLLVLRSKRAGLKRPFRAPFNLSFKKYSLSLTALVGAISTLGVWVLIFFTKPEGRNVGILWFIGGVMMYLGYRRKKKLAPLAQIAIKKVKIPDYTPMKLERILVMAHSSRENESIQLACQLAKQHRAKLLCTFIIEVAHAMPIDVRLQKREEVAEGVLKQMEAIGREHHLVIELEIVRARSLEQAILKLVDQHEIDLVILGVKGRDLNELAAFARAERLLLHAPCRIWFCKSK